MRVRIEAGQWASSQSRVCDRKSSNVMASAVSQKIRLTKPSPAGKSLCVEEALCENLEAPWKDPLLALKLVIAHLT